MCFMFIFIFASFIVLMFVSMYVVCLLHLGFVCYVVM